MGRCLENGPEWTGMPPDGAFGGMRPCSLSFSIAAKFSSTRLELLGAVDGIDARDWGRPSGIAGRGRRPGPDGVDWE